MEMLLRPGGLSTRIIRPWRRHSREISMLFRNTMWPRWETMSGGSTWMVMSRTGMASRARLLPSAVRAGAPPGAGHLQMSFPCWMVQRLRMALVQAMPSLPVSSQGEPQ
jgi:hypothetical protein